MSLVLSVDSLLNAVDELAAEDADIPLRRRWRPIPRTPGPLTATRLQKSVNPCKSLTVKTSDCTAAIKRRDRHRQFGLKQQVCCSYSVCFFVFFLSIYWPFLALLTVQLEECDRKQGKIGGVTRSKGTQTGSRARVRCRASAHGSHVLPTELSGAPIFCVFASNSDE